MKYLGGIPINRQSPKGVVEQMASAFKATDRLILVITPEGTRSNKKELKTGFYQIAKRAETPIFVIGIDYPSKTIELGPVWSPEDFTLPEVEEKFVPGNTYRDPHLNNCPPHVHITSLFEGNRATPPTPNTPRNQPPAEIGSSHCSRDGCVISL